MSSKVVISYRRTDSPAMAGRICDHLKTRYGNDSVYMDIDNIPLGIDFRDHIYAALDQADVLVVIVGPKWIGEHREGHPRIAEDHDLVRAEVEAALKRKIPVVPVLVDGASMPEPAILPEAIKSFAFRNAAAIDSGVDFHQQMDRLARSLDRMVGMAPPPARSQQTRRPHRILRVALPTAAAAAVIGVAVFVWFKQPPAGMGGPWSPPPGRTLWAVDGSMVYLEPTGPRRQFFFVEPSSDLATLGARPGLLLFSGQRVADDYEGKMIAYAGRCASREYDVFGPVTNNNETVTVLGKAPRIDPDSCMKIGEQERTHVFNLK